MNVLGSRFSVLGSRFSVLALAVVLLCGIVRAGEAGEPFKGITISCQTWGKEWETPEMAVAMDEVKRLGANAIAIHPYALVEESGGIRIPADPEPSYLTTPLRWAQEKKLRVMLVPHLAYWHTKFSWRGEIDYATDAEWERFFADYEKWIVGMARLAEKHDVELLCVGLEYVKAEKFDGRWRRIFRAVRQVYRGKITYGANWDRVGDVPFWDAVDLIGVLAYFPLTNTPNPSSAEISAGWEKWMDALGALSEKHGKPVVFTEIGYNESAQAASKPWAFPKGGENAAAIQQRCLAAGLALQKDHPFLAGMFLWKWFPNLDLPDEYTFDLRTPALKRTISEAWGD